MQAALAGFALGLSLIVAIGAQNAFVLRQGLMRAHVLPVCLICAISDAVLIVAGIAGFGALTQALPGLEPAMRLFGAAFLTWYGARSLRSAWRGGEAMGEGRAALSLRAAVLTCLAFTWLNPHVYLDTVMLLGAISAQYDQPPPLGLARSPPRSCSSSAWATARGRWRRSLPDRAPGRCSISPWRRSCGRWRPSWSSAAWTASPRAFRFSRDCSWSNTVA